MISITDELMPYSQLKVDKMIVADDDSYTTARDSTAWATGDDPPDPILLLHVWNVSWGVATGTGVSFAHMAIARGMPFFS